MESIPTTNQPTRLPVWQLVIRKPYEPSSRFVQWLSNNVSNYLVGEHPADDEVSSTHCHILIEGLKVTTEGFRKSLIRCDISGSDYSLMKKRKSKNGIREDYTRDFLAIYIIKGQIPYVKCSSFNETQIALWASKWINHKAERSEAEHGSISAVPVKKPNTVYQDCDEIIDTIPDWNQRNPSLVERTDVVKAIIAWANQKRKALHSVQVMNFYDVIMCNAVPEYYKTLCVDLINRRHK